MFEKYVEQVLDIFNYVDSILITDKKGKIRYYHSNRTDLNQIDKKTVIGKNIIELYCNLTRESSTVYEVLRTGKPIINYKQELKVESGKVIEAITSTMPIQEDDEVIGTIDVSSYSVEQVDVQKKVKSRNQLYKLEDIVTIDYNMNRLKSKIKKVANTSSSVLIYGETGTGKELVAQSIHTEGSRKNGNFVSQNCAAIPSSLMESILFGTKKGGFTGAEDSPGLFELANGGTLFLDEINSMEASIQSKLLKAVEEKKIVRVGGTKPIMVDVKIVSATNMEIEQLFESGCIRKDLLYRLGTVRLEIPPLHERPVDLAPLAKQFIREFNIEMGRNILDLTEEVYELFTLYDWPGNVRELRNIIENAFNLCSGRFIEKDDLPKYMINAVSINNKHYSSTYENGLKCTMEEIEKDIIIHTLNNSNTKAEVARKLKLSKQALQYKLEKYGLDS